MSKYPPLFTFREDARALVRDVRRVLGLPPSTVIISNTSPLTEENPMTDHGPTDSERYDVVFHTSKRGPAEEWRREHNIPRNRFVDADHVNDLRGRSKVIVVGPRLIVSDEVDAILGYVPTVTTWDGRSNLRALLGIQEPVRTTDANPQTHWINAAIEVCPDEAGGWKVTEYTGQASNRILYRSRTKRPAVLVGRGAALTWKCELRVKDRKGRYTRESTSYAGNGSTR